MTVIFIICSKLDQFFVNTLWRLVGKAIQSQTEYSSL